MLYIFRRNTPKHPWTLAKRVPLPEQKKVVPVSYRVQLEADGHAEVWIVEATTEQQARGKLRRDPRGRQLVFSGRRPL